MTIEVHIINNDATRTVIVYESHLARDTGRREVGNAVWLEPGKSHTFHVHMLKDLLLQEYEPR